MPLSAAEVGALSRLFDQALELPPEALEAWLANLPVEQQALLPYLRRMLQAHAAQPEEIVPRKERVTAVQPVV